MYVDHFMVSYGILLYKACRNTLCFLRYECACRLLLYLGISVSAKREVGGARETAQDSYHAVCSLFFFTAIIAIPKSLVNGSGEILQPFIGILLGKASWFITTLIVCEVIFTFLVKAGKTWISIVLLVVGVFLKHYDYPDYWNVVRALQNVIFLYAGYMCKRKDLHFGDNRWTWAPLSLLVVVLLKYVYLVSPVGDAADKASLLRACCYYADMMAGIVFLLSVASMFAYSRFMRYVGRNSLYYYFFCGACPTIAAIITKSFIAPYDGFYPMVIIPFVIAVVLDTGVAVLIKRLRCLIVLPFEYCGVK